MEFNTGDIAWVLASTALVLFMTPGLAFFYGGMVRSKNVLAMLMQNFFAMGLIGVLWACRRLRSWRSASPAKGFIGNFDFAFMKDVGRRWCPASATSALGDPGDAVRAFQMMFAIITPGPHHRRDRRSLEVQVAYAVFLGLWLLLVYSPVAHWVFAGRLAVQAGRARLRRRDGRPHQRRHRGARRRLVLGKRKGWPNEPMPPHSLPWTLHRHRHPVVRLVRVQRGLGARARTASRPRRS